jgi:hypothetical protein
VHSMVGINTWCVACKLTQAPPGCCARFCSLAELLAQPGDNV